MWALKYKMAWLIKSYIYTQALDERMHKNAFERKQFYLQKECTFLILIYILPLSVKIKMVGKCPDIDCFYIWKLDYYFK